MKWPVVPRSVHDDVVNDLRTRLDASEQAREKLTQTVIDMKVAGGHIPRVITGERLEQKPRNEVERAVEDNPFFRSNAALRRQQIEWANRTIEEGGDRDTILARLRGFGRVAADAVDDDEEDDRLE
jgi:hypothetical protein